MWVYTFFKFIELFTLNGYILLSTNYISKKVTKKGEKNEGKIKTLEAKQKLTKINGLALQKPAKKFMWKNDSNKIVKL